MNTGSSNQALLGNLGASSDSLGLKSPGSPNLVNFGRTILYGKTKNPKSRDKIHIFVSIAIVLFIAVIFVFLLTESEFPRNHPLKPFYISSTKTIDIHSDTSAPIEIDGFHFINHFRISCSHCLQNNTGIRLHNMNGLKTISIVGNNTLIYSNIDLKNLPALSSVEIVTAFSFVHVHELHLKGLPKLEKVMMNVKQSFNLSSSLILDDLPSLTSLSVTGESSFTQLTTFNLTRLPKLYDLEVSGNDMFDIVPMMVIEDFPSLRLMKFGGNKVFYHTKSLTLRNLTSLTKITTTGSYIFFQSSLIAENLPNLDEISIDSSFTFAHSHTVSLFKFPRLRTIAFSGASTFRDNVNATFENLPLLRHITFSGSSTFNSNRNIDFIDLPSLESIIIRGYSSLVTTTNLTMIHLPKLREISFDCEYCVQGTSANGTIILHDIPSVSSLNFGEATGVGVPFKIYKRILRGKGVSEWLVSEWVKHLKTHSVWKNVIEVIDV